MLSYVVEWADYSFDREYRAYDGFGAQAVDGTIGLQRIPHLRRLCRSKGLKKQHSVDTIEIKLDEIGRFFVGGGEK